MDRRPERLLEGRDGGRGPKRPSGGGPWSRGDEERVGMAADTSQLYRPTRLTSDEARYGLGKHTTSLRARRTNENVATRAR